jgi:hypothetical protein
MNPLDSLIFYTKYNWDQRKGKIMIVFNTKDGSNRTVIRDIEYTSSLTIDLILRRIIWLNRDLDIDSLRRQKFFNIWYIKLMNIILYCFPNIGSLLLLD